MPRTLPLSLFGTLAVALLVPAAPAPVKKSDRPVGIYVLDDCDEEYKGKNEYRDNLTLFDAAGKQTFRVTGFNTCQAISSTRAIATDRARKSIWVSEHVAPRLRRFDLAGKETLSIEVAGCSAVAVDPETGNVWALVGRGIGGRQTVVYSDKGKKLATHEVSGWDLTYDRLAKAIWIAERKLTKIDAASGKQLLSLDVSTWCASSVDVDPRTGAVWVTVRNHPDVNGSVNQLLGFDGKGKKVATVDLGDKIPFRVSVDPKDSTVWVANLRKSVEQFSAKGKSLAEHKVEALAVQVDPAGGDVWVVTPTELLRMTPKGDATRRARHAGKTSQAWIAALE